MAPTRVRQTVITGIMVTGVLLSSCVTDRVENVRLRPPSIGDELTVLKDSDVQRALEVSDEIAMRFAFRRVTYSPEAGRIQDDVTARMGFKVVAEYVRDRAPGRGAFVVLHVSTAIDGSDLVVSTRTLRGGSADAFLTEVRNNVESVT